MDRRRPRILIVCERLPLPVRSGADLRLLAVAKGLSRVVTVGVISISEHASAQPEFVELWRSGGCESPGSRRLLQQLGEQPDDPFAPFASDEAIGVVRATAQSFDPDVVVFYRLQAWRVAASALEGLRIPALLDLDESNARAVEAMQSLGRQDPAARLRVRFTQAAARYEERALAEADAVWVSSEVEAAAVRRDAEPRRVSIVPNVVEVGDYLPARVPRSANRLVFPANFAYPPNEAAARELVEGISPLLPHHEILLVGSFIPAWMRGQLPGNVTVIGPVTSMAEYLASSAAALIPLRAGTGTRLKILECLASSTPVISTAMGAEGLDLAVGEHYLLAETPEEFARAVAELDDDPRLAHSIARAGWQAVRDRYSIEALTPALAAAVGAWIDAPATT